MKRAASTTSTTTATAPTHTATNTSSGTLFGTATTNKTSTVGAPVGLQRKKTSDDAELPETYKEYHQTFIGALKRWPFRLGAMCMVISIGIITTSYMIVLVGLVVINFLVFVTSKLL